MAAPMHAPISDSSNPSAATATAIGKPPKPSARKVAISRRRAATPE